MIDPELEGPLWRTSETVIVLAANLVRKAYDARLAPLGVNLAEARLLVYIDERGPETQTRLADRLGVGRAAAGQMIDRLEKRGLVTRQADPADRRVWLVTGTKASARVARKIVDVSEALRAELHVGVPAAERKAMVETMLKLQRNVAGVLAAGELAANRG